MKANKQALQRKEKHKRGSLESINAGVDRHEYRLKKDRLLKRLLSPQQQKGQP